MNLLNTTKNPHETSKQYIYRVLHDNIMSLTLSPGQTISEKDLALHLNVSRTPVREAISILQSNKLIDVESQKGTFISKLNLSLIEESFFMRKILDVAIITDACHNLSPEGIMELEKNIYFQEYYLKFPGSSADFFKLDNEFHYIIYKNLNKENIWQAIQTLSTHFDRLRVLDAVEKSHIETVITQHKKIFNIIINKDLKNVQKAVCDHISNYKLHFETLTKTYHDYFTSTNYPVE